MSKSQSKRFYQKTGIRRPHTNSFRRDLMGIINELEENGFAPNPRTKSLINKMPTSFSDLWISTWKQQIRLLKKEKTDG